MVDVFVSYKAEDRRRVVPLVQALEADGLTVWWDAHIAGGVDWRDSIEEHLDAARCVIVVWSNRSVGREGRFVRDEATRAQRRDTYLPVRIDKVEPPLGFGETQAISLTGWSGDRSDARYQSVLSAVRAITAGERPAGQPTSGALHVSRRAVMATASGAAAVAAVGGWFLLKPGAARATSIAVLPFANLSGDPAQSYFSDGIAEELRAALARIPKMKVMARTSSEKVRDDDIQTAATRLDVDNILTGSVRRSPSTIRINAQLVNGSDGLERWSQAYDRPAGDALSVQTDIAQQVASALRLELGGGGAAANPGGTENHVAQDLFLKAKASWQSNASREHLREANVLFDEAIKLDPNFAEARAQKAIALLVYAQNFAAGAAEYARETSAADAEARRALRIAPGLQSGYAAQAMARSGKFDFKGALADWQNAYTDESRVTDTVAEYSRFLSSVGRSSDGFEWADKSISADPLNARSHQSKVWAYFCARRYREASEAARKLLEWAPRRGSTLARLGDSLLILGKTEEALAAYTQCDPNHPSRLLGEALVAWRKGDRAGSDGAVAQLTNSYGETASFRLAGIHAQRGEKDLALRQLQRAFSVKDFGMASLSTDPWVDPLRTDAAFKALQARMDFP
jgi:TolB-like protein/Tfp pilus assembly protein PilF